VCCLLGAAPRAHAQEPAVLATLRQAVAAAEEGLRSGERQIAESEYRTALLLGWMLLGTIDVAEGRPEDARRAFEHASSSAVENGAALQSLALVQLQVGDVEPALGILTKMAAASPRRLDLRVTLAQALVMAGKPAEAVQELEEAHALAPDDPQLAFALASGYLRVKNVEAAERTFAQVVEARPIPETHVLIGRTYRDFQYYDQARAALQRALAMNPRTRRAHYYLGTTAVMQEGLIRVDEAIDEFERELAIVPDDGPTRLRLGMALVEARRNEEALPLLESAVAGSSPSPDAWLYLGRCQLALGRAAEAVKSLREALKTGTRTGSSVEQSRLRSVHYQLATALRQTGAIAEADREFAEAERLSDRRTESDRAELASYMSDASESEPLKAAGLTLEASGVDAIRPAERAAIASDVRVTLARAYLNLGILQVHASRFDRAAELFEKAALVDPAFPQVQFSLGVAYFNAGRHDQAVAPLSRVVEQEPQHADARRMLALAYLNTGEFARAADLLRDDERRAADPSLQYAYGLALVQSDRAQEAEAIFTKLLADHPDMAELNVVLGHAYAAQDDYEGALKAFERALAIKSDVAEANAGLGIIYLQQGRLPEAEDALRKELAANPRSAKARYTLATVLDLEGRADAALNELRTLLGATPAHADGRYLLGKILLARGDAADAARHLEIAVKLSPEDANIHYQLGQAYQRLGRADLAEREFEEFRRLKDRGRGGPQ
jgi:tetratricopeptide (TPR) repeat protein